MVHRGGRSKPPRIAGILVAVGAGCLLAAIVLGALMYLGY